MTWGMIATLAVVVVALTAGVALNVVRKADYHASLAGIWAFLSASNFATGDVTFGVIDGGLAAWDAWRWWKHRDDDDNHRGRRLKTWAKSKLPKPAARVVRNPT